MYLRVLNAFVLLFGLPEEFRGGVSLGGGPNEDAHSTGQRCGASNGPGFVP